MEFTSTKGKGYLITEAATTGISPRIVHDSEVTTKFVAEIQEAEAPNRNGRIYSKEALDSAIRHYSIQEKLKNKALVCEAGHPLSDDPRRQMYIDQTNISHIITDIWWEGNKLMAKIETANTRVGRDMQGLIRQGSKVAFSMRGMSDNVKKDGQYTRVGSPLMITCWDWVILPSHPNSYMVQEGVEQKVSSSIQADKKVLTEGVLTPYNSGDLLKFVTESSQNAQDVVDAFGFKFNLDNVSYGEDQMLSIKENNETLKIFLEENLKSELDDYYSKIF